PPLLFTAPPPPATHTLSLHDALPIFVDLRAEEDDPLAQQARVDVERALVAAVGLDDHRDQAHGLLLPLKCNRLVACTIRNRTVADRKSTRLNSSHVSISYAVFCLKKK